MAADTCTERAVPGKVVDVHGLYEVYDAMLQEIMKRGKIEPGQKTMIDAIWYFVHTGKDWTQAGVMKKSFRILWKAPQTVRSVQRKWKL